MEGLLLAALQSNDAFQDLGVWRMLASFPAFCAMVVSCVHILLHVCFNTATNMRPCVLRMLLVIPCYATVTYVCLINETEVRLTYMISSVRDLYEPVILVSFVQFLLAVIGQRQSSGQDEASNAEDEPSRPFSVALAEKLSSGQDEPAFRGRVMKIWECVRVPIRCEGDDGQRRWGRSRSVAEVVLDRYRYWPDFVLGVLIGILQYVVVMIIYFCIRLYAGFHYANPAGTILEKLGLDLKAGSCGIAMFHLLLLAFNLTECEATKGLVDGISLEAKFLSIKGIVFFVVAQNWVIKICPDELLLSRGLHETKRFQDQRVFLTPEMCRQTLQDFFLCFELFLFSIFHLKAYGAEEFNKLAAKGSLRKAIVNAKQNGLHKTAMLEEAITNAIQNGLEKEFVCVLADPASPPPHGRSVSLLEENHERVVYIDVSEGSTRPQQQTVILKDSMLDVAQKELQKLREGSAEETERRSSWKACCGSIRFGVKSLLGFMELVNDIMILREYAKTHRKKMGDKIQEIEGACSGELSQGTGWLELTWREVVNIYGSRAFVPEKVSNLFERRTSTERVVLYPASMSTPLLQQS